MALTPGTRLGPYEILSLLGSGGMGEVYKAKDTRLDRTVAIKVLPADLATDPGFRERFEREAKSISALNHPNICTLHDVGRDNDIDFLVMEYLEGETLAARLAKGQLGLKEASRIGAEIASAFDTAHRHGIVHRDLKPGNVFLARSAGSSVSPTVKLLDFGLAKIVPPGGLLSAATTALSLGIQDEPLTARGTILGTLQYMAPEQLEGKEADARADIFSFGAVFYEMLTGRKAFEGQNQASLLGAILKDQPPPISKIQPLTPPSLERLVRKCLAKERDDRWQTARDLLDELRWIAEGGGAAAPVLSRSRSREWLAWTTAAVLGAITLGLAVLHPPAGTSELTIAAAENSTLETPADFAISPDGLQIAFVASDSKNVPRLWVRELGKRAARALLGTEQPSQPFWSPNNRQVGFFADQKLKTVDVFDGSVKEVCPAPTSPGGTGGTWNGDIIVFGLTNGPLQRVDVGVGTPTPMFELGKGEASHRFPSFLPDGRHVLYLALRGASRELRVASLGATDTTSLGTVESNALYSSGHLLFSRGGALMAQPFDLSTRQPKGEQFLVAEHVPANTNGRAFFSVSTTGVLGYFGGDALPMSRLTWIGRDNKPQGVVGDPGAYYNLSLSPDEEKVAVSMATGSPANRDIWVINTSGISTRVTDDPASEGDPIFWSRPDGLQILFNSNRDGRFNSAFRRQADGFGQDEPVMRMGRDINAPDLSHDGGRLVYSGSETEPQNDIWVLQLSGDCQKVALVHTTLPEGSPAFSPLDDWLAYDSGNPDSSEVYVQRVSGSVGRTRISGNGGWAPRWSGDGKELFFLALDGRMMVANITIVGQELRASEPQKLFDTPLRKTADRHTYAVTKDGKHFLMPLRDPRQAAVPITVFLDWLGTVKK